VTTGTSVIVARTPDELAAHVAAWESLAAAAIEPNVFQEPWMLLAAWRAFGLGCNLRAVLIYGPDPKHPTAAHVLYGLFLLERLPRLQGVPIAVMTVWQHALAPLCTPLIRKDVGGPCLAALITWLRTGPDRASLVQFPEYGAGDAFEQLLTEFVNRGRLFAHVADRHYRANLLRGSDSETVLARAMSGGNRKELRRQARRLAETGTVEVRTLATGEDPEPWLAQFLSLERAGWKGEEASALASDAARREFFEAIFRAAHGRGRLMLLGLFLDGRPIAMKCSFLALPGSFAFKIAFDEQLARFSPGVQLELQNVAALHDMPGWSWMDSCASPRHFMIERLWPDRRAMATTILASGRAPGGLVVSGLPLLRWIYRTFIRRRPGSDAAAKSEASHE
jgi:hypothetical protein